MRIKQAEIVGFGKWRQQTFDFAPGNQLVYGLNEAGKSTLYQFIQAILFGFPSKGKKRQDYTPRDGTAYGGSLWLEHPTYGEIKVERFKRQNRGKAKVYLPDGGTGEEDLLERLLAPLNKRLFQQVFTFQQEQLSQLELLQENELQDLLVSFGISGSEQLFQQRVAYQGKAADIYKRKSKKLPLNLLMQEKAQLQEKIRQKEAQEAEFQQLLKGQQQTEQKLAEAEKTDHSLQQKALKIKQQLLNWSNYEEWQSLKQLAQAPLFPQTAELADFYQKYQQLSSNLEEQEAAFEKHSGMDQQSARYYFYLEQEEKIQELLQQKVEVMRILDRETQIDQEATSISQVLTAGDEYGWRKQPPQPLTDDRIQNYFQAKVQAEKTLSQQEVRLSMLQDQHQQLEDEINQLETDLTAELQTESSKVNYLPIIAVITLGILASFFVSSPLSWIIRFLTVAAGGFFFYQKQQKKEPKISNRKALWQEKLVKLDELTGQIVQEEQVKKELHRQLATQDADFSQLLKRHHLPQTESLAESLAINRQSRQFSEALQTQHTLQLEKQQLREKILHYEGEFQFLEDWLPLQQKTVTGKIQHLETFVKEMEQLRFAQTYQQNTMLKQQINETKRKQKELLEQSQTLLQEAQLRLFSEIPNFLQQQREIAAAKEKSAELEQTLRPLFQQAVTQEELTLQQQQINQQLAENQLGLRRLQEQKQRYTLQQENLQADGTLDQLYQALSSLDAEIQQLAEKWSVAHLTSMVLGDLATELSEQQLPQLLKEASRYFGILTDQKHQQLQLQDEQLMVSQNGEWLSLYDLSTGTKNQLVMAFRFAFLKTNKPWCPVIIDDGWLHYDHLRKRRLAELFKEFGKNYQIICLSSDQEMVSYYQELQQPVWELKGAAT